MGRSMLVALSQPGSAQVRSLSVKLLDEKLGCYFEVFRRGNELYQSQYALDASGTRSIGRLTSWSTPSAPVRGGITYAIQRDNFLLQAPLSFYSRTGTWELSPGYQSLHHGFNRPILSQCVACHSGKRLNTLSFWM